MNRPTVPSVAISHGINATSSANGAALSRPIRDNFATGLCATEGCPYLFANRRADRMKVLVHDDMGVWLAARRLNQGKLNRPDIHHGGEVELDSERFQALVLACRDSVGAGGGISML